MLARSRLSLLLVAAALVSAPASAEPSDADRRRAEALFQQARALMNDGAFAEACAKLADAQRIDPGEGTALALAVCYEKEDRVATALEAFRRARESAAKSGRADRVAFADRRIAELARVVSRLVVAPQDAELDGLAIRVAGREWPREKWGAAIECDGGEYVVEATAPGRAPFRVTVSVRARGDEVRVAIPSLGAVPSLGAIAPPGAPQAPPVTAAPRPAPPEAPSPSLRPLAAGALAGVAIAAGVVGTYYGLRASSKLQDARNQCHGNQCSPTGLALDDESKTAGTISTAAFGLCAVGLTTAAILYFSAPRAPASGALRVVPVVTARGGAIGVSGSF